MNLSDSVTARRRRVRLAVYSLLLSVVLFLLSAIAVVGQRDIETARLPSPDLPAQRTNTVRQYIVRPVRDKYQRTEIARTGAAIDAVGSDWVLISANEIESDAVADLGYSVQPIFPSSGLLVFPDYDAEYHDYDEMVAEIVQAAADHLDTVELFSIGRSYEGRDLWMAKISDHPALDEAEPEILFSAHQHGKEHLAVEQALYTLRVLTDEYHTNPQVRHLVDSREIFVLFDINPDGGEYDHSGGYYHNWRKNRQPNVGSPYIGTDLNRNWAYKWGCCGGSSANPASDNYRGLYPFSAPETEAVRSFVESRVIDGEQQISAHIDFHTYGELVLWPYAHTYDDIPPDMTTDDHAVFVAIGQELASLSDFTAEQASDLYIHDGAIFDWMYGVHGVFSFCFELYPEGSSGGGFYPPDEVILSETVRHREAVLLLAELADCPYRATCQETVFCLPSSRALSIPENDLQAFWTLDQVCGQRLDISGQGNDLAAYGTETLALGQIGLATKLESAGNGHLVISDTVQNGLDIAGSLTLFGWIKPETLGRSQVLSEKYEEEGDERAFRLELRSDDTVGFFVSPDGTWSDDYLLVADPPVPLAVDKWYHIAAVFDAAQNSLSVYVDGVLIGRRTVAYDAVFNSSAPFMLGASLQNGQVIRYYAGLLDEWGVYSRALTGEEIERLMGGGLLRGEGQLEGNVTTASGGAPIDAATIIASDGAGRDRFSTADPSGYYLQDLLVGTYTVTASAYGYLPSVVTGLPILTNTITTQDFALSSAPTHIVSGKVSSADRGWSLKAHIKILGHPVDPPPPAKDIWTDPITGEYSVTLAEGVQYTFHIEAEDHIPHDFLIGPLTSNETHASALLPDFTLGCPPGHTSLPLFSDGLESGTLGPNWHVYTTAHGRVRIDNAFPYSGSYGVLLDASLVDGEGAYSYAAVILEQDLTGSDQVAVNFAWRSFSDESHPGDGVFLSDDLGATWLPVFSFNHGPASFQYQGVDLTAVAAANGLTLGDRFWIKFQYYDDYPISADGHAIDDVAVRGCMPFEAGRVAGYVFDDNTGLPLGGAVVRANGGQGAITNVDGFYETVAVAGSQAFTATMTGGYVPDIHHSTVVDGETIRQDFRLMAAVPRVNPDAIALTVKKGFSATVPVTLSNLGGAELSFSVEVDPSDLDWPTVDPDSGTVGPWGVQRVAVALDTRAQEITRVGDFHAYLNLSNGSPYGSLQIPVTLTVIAPNLNVTKSGPATILAGDTITYAISYQNNGTDLASDVLVEDDLPSGVTASSATIWNLGDVPPGSGGMIEFSATVDGGLAGGTTLLNAVSISSSNIDIDNSNNHDSLATVVFVPPRAGFSSTTPDYLGQETRFTNDTTGYPAPVYGWDFGDGETSAAAHPTHVYQTVGTFTVTLVASSSAGNDACVDLVRIVDVPPSASFIFDSEVVVGETCLFTNTSTGTNLEFLWDFGDGETSTQRHPAHVYQTEGVFDVTLTATNSSGSDAVSQPIAVTQQPPQPLWDIDITINGAPAGPLPVTVVASDVIQLVDHVWVTFTRNVTFTLVETRTPSLQLLDWGSDSGEGSPAGFAFTWDAINVTANTWHIITRTFRALAGTWQNHQITANLWVENADAQLPVRVVALDHAYYGAALVPPTVTRAGEPGSTVIYDLLLSNSGNITDSYALDVTGNAWATTAPSFVGPLSADTSVGVRVAVDIPAGADGGDVAVITAISQNDPHYPPARASSILSTTAITTFHVFLPTITKIH